MLHFSQVAEALERRRWIYAKTMPQCPHWYCLRKEWRIELPFEQVVQYIRDVGYWEKYGRNRYMRLNVNGYKYWSMGAPLPATILINRAKIERPAPYDEIAPVYGSLWATQDALREDMELFDLIGPTPGSVLDIGCGTGLFLMHRRPARYFGVDPSQGMLDRFLAVSGDSLRQICSPLEEPDAPLRVQCGTFEALWTPERFDHAVALYGAASYIDPAARETMRRQFAQFDANYVDEIKPKLVKVQIGCILSNDYHGTKLSTFVANHGSYSKGKGKLGGWAPTAEEAA